MPLNKRATYCICLLRALLLDIFFASEIAFNIFSGNCSCFRVKSGKLNKVAPSLRAAWAFFFFSVLLSRRLICDILIIRTNWVLSYLKDNCPTNIIILRINSNNHMVKTDFSINKSKLQGLAQQALTYAKTLGATSASVDVSEGVGQSVTVRKAQTETIEFSRDKGLSITAYQGHKLGNSSTSDLSEEAVHRAVEAAITIAKFTQEDEFSGLPAPDSLATEHQDLDLFHPLEISVEKSLKIAKECEDAAFSVDSKIKNSDGATFSTNRHHFIHANSLGFMGGYPSTQHSISCAVVAGKTDDMQRDHWWTLARDFAKLDKANEVGKIAGERAVRRMGSRKLKTQKVPILYEASVASSLLGHLVSALSGGALYRKQSFLVDSLGKQIFPEFINIKDHANLLSGLGSSPFDQEGVITRNRDIVKSGKIDGYFLASYSSRKLGMESTGNAGGSHNLEVYSTGESFDEILKKMQTGFLVTEMLGMGINGLTGDYSRGAAGFWVENGEIAFPVEEVTIAGNLKDMFRNIIAVGTDKLVRSSRQSGSVLIDGMTVAGD